MKLLIIEKAIETGKRLNSINLKIDKFFLLNLGEVDKDGPEYLNLKKLLQDSKALCSVFMDQFAEADKEVRQIARHFYCMDSPSENDKIGHSFFVMGYECRKTSSLIDALEWAKELLTQLQTSKKIQN